jgi:hypothetical protein
MRATLESMGTDIFAVERLRNMGCDLKVVFMMVVSVFQGRASKT